MVKEDIAWMGLGITENVTQSERLPLYYDLCRQLIEKGGAYVCTCDNERFKELKMAKTACPCRSQPVKKISSSGRRCLTTRSGKGRHRADKDRSQSSRSGNA